MKDADLRRFLGLTWTGWLNVFLQFTGFRLARTVEVDGTITAWKLRWAPIWRNGWTLPTLRWAPALPSGRVARTADGGHVLRPGTMLMHVGTQAVRQGETAVVAEDGRITEAPRGAAAGTGTFLHDAPAGGTVTVAIPAVDPAAVGRLVAWPDGEPVQHNNSGEPCDMWDGPCTCGAWHKAGAMSCAHRVHTPFMLRNGSPSTGVRLCSDCPAKFFLCAFCDHTEPFCHDDSSWRYFALDGRQEPTSFPVDLVWYREGRKWLCCPTCLAESGETVMLAYLNNRYAMHPEPSYTCVYRPDLSTGRRIVIEERTS